MARRRRPEEISTDRSPCDKCEFAEECAEKDLACRSFYSYVRFGVPHKKWKTDEPSRHWFERSFKNASERLKK